MLFIPLNTRNEVFMLLRSVTVQCIALLSRKLLLFLMTMNIFKPGINSLRIVEVQLLT